MKAQEATLTEIANSNLRRHVAHNKAFNCAEIDDGDMALFFNAQNRKSSPRRRGRAKVLEIGETGVTVSFQSQNFKVARYRVRKRIENSEFAERDGKLPPTAGYPWVGALDGDTGLAPMLPEDVPNDHEMGDGGLPTESGGKPTAVTEEPSMASPRLIPAPFSPTNSGGLGLPPIMGGSGISSVSLDQQCAPSQSPECASGTYDHLAYNELRN